MTTGRRPFFVGPPTLSSTHFPSPRQVMVSPAATGLKTAPLPLEELEIPAQPCKEVRDTVSSLRLDAVLSAMLHVSRGTAAELIEAGRVEINHLPVEKPHAPVYEQDVFTVRGKGRFRLTALPGKSKKDRSIIEFFQY